MSFKLNNKKVTTLVILSNGSVVTKKSPFTKNNHDLCSFLNKDVNNSVHWINTSNSNNVIHEKSKQVYSFRNKFLNT